MPRLRSKLMSRLSQKIPKVQICSLLYYSDLARGPVDIIQGPRFVSRETSNDLRGSCKSRLLLQEPLAVFFTLKKCIQKKDVKKYCLAFQGTIPKLEEF
jgi:hypothetical protein